VLTDHGIKRLVVEVKRPSSLAWSRRYSKALEIYPQASLFWSNKAIALGALGRHEEAKMHQTKKGKDWYFGMKAHLGVDSKNKIIHSAVVTPANVADSAVGHVVHAVRHSLAESVKLFQQNLVPFRTHDCFSHVQFSLGKLQPLHNRALRYVAHRFLPAAPSGRCRRGNAKASSRRRGSYSKISSA
jgi:Transposase DDE domain